MNLKEMTAHIRKRLKHEGIKARVRLYRGAGNSEKIQIIEPEHGKGWTERELGLMHTICDVNGLTQFGGYPIDREVMLQLTGKGQFDFYFGLKKREPKPRTEPRPPGEAWVS